MWPIVFQWHEITLYSYPLFIGLAWGLGFRLSESDLPNSIKHRDFIFWFIGLFVCSWIGAKLLFLFTQNQFNISELSVASNFWLGGGFVYLGGLLGGLLFTFVIGGIIPSLRLRNMQFTIIPLLWAHAIGRVGCFLAGCCYGTETNLPWAIHLHGLERHPVQIYEAFSLGLFAFYLMKLKKDHTHFLSLYMVGYGFIRWVLEWFRGDEIRGFTFNMSTSQWVSIGLIILGLINYYQTLRLQKTAL